MLLADCDGKTDVAVFRAGTWYLQRSRDGFTGMGWGMATDKPVPGDYNGDGKADIGVYRNGTWHLLLSGQSEASYSAAVLGGGSDAPLPNAGVR